MNIRTVLRAALVPAITAGSLAVGTAGAAGSHPASPPTTEPPAAAEPAGETAVPPNASLSEIDAAIVGMHGPTNDVPGVLSPFVPPPQGIPTPADAVVHGVDLFFHPTDDPETSSYQADLVFEASAAAPEMITFFQEGCPPPATPRPATRWRTATTARSAACSTPQPTRRRASTG